MHSLPSPLGIGCPLLFAPEADVPRLNRRPTVPIFNPGWDLQQLTYPKATSSHSPSGACGPPCSSGNGLPLSSCLLGWAHVRPLSPGPTAPPLNVGPMVPKSHMLPLPSRNWSFFEAVQHQAASRALKTQRVIPSSRSFQDPQQLKHQNSSAPSSLLERVCKFQCVPSQHSPYSSQASPVPLFCATRFFVRHGIDQ